MTTATDQTSPEAESLTGAELDAVRRYAAIIEGIPDCFDCGDGIGAVPSPATSHARTSSA